MSHVLNHVSQAVVLGHAAPKQDLVLPDVSHCPLGHLCEHRERRLLHGQRYVLQWHAISPQCDSGGHQAGERHVHALHGVWELVVPVALFGQLLEHRACVKPHAQLPPELVQHVPHADVLGLAEDPVAALGEGNDLSVPSRCIQKSGVIAAALCTPDLYMGYAVVHTDHWDPKRARQNSCGSTRHTKARAEPWPHRERDESDVGEAHASPVDGLADDP